MRTIASTLMAILFTVTCTAVGADEPSRDELLKTFAGEFIVIQPGKPGFPQEVAIGTHRIQLTKTFSIAKYETTQSLYESVMGANPSRWKGRRNSVEMMTWLEASQFCERITLLLQAANLIRAEDVIRLPTEVEWEYCCRAGTTTKFSFGDSATRAGDRDKLASILDEYGWHTGNAAGNDPPVGAKKPNPWGLYDMHGYLWEMTSSPWTNPLDPNRKDQNVVPEKTSFVIRGGSWKDRFEHLQSDSRREFKPADKDDAVGFRCVRAAKK